MATEINRQQQRLQRILPWIEIVDKLLQPFCIVVSVITSSWLYFIIFTECKSIVYDSALWLEFLDKPTNSSFDSLLVYTVLFCAAIDILCRLLLAWPFLSRMFKISEQLWVHLQMLRVSLIVTAHYLYVNTWYFETVTRKNSPTETIILCGDSYKSSWITVFKKSRLENYCIRSLYYSLPWSFLFMDLSICSSVSRKKGSNCCSHITAHEALQDLRHD